MAPPTTIVATTVAMAANKWTPLKVAVMLAGTGSA